MFHGSERVPPSSLPIVGVVMGAWFEEVQRAEPLWTMSAPAHAGSAVNSAPYLNYSKRLKQGHDVITRTVPERTRNMWRQSLGSCEKEQQTHSCI